MTALLTGLWHFMLRRLEGAELLERSRHRWMMTGGSFFIAAGQAVSLLAPRLELPVWITLPAVLPLLAVVLASDLLILEIALVRLFPSKHRRITFAILVAALLLLAWLTRSLPDFASPLMLPRILIPLLILLGLQSLIYWRLRKGWPLPDRASGLVILLLWLPGLGLPGMELPELSWFAGLMLVWVDLVAIGLTLILAEILLSLCFPRGRPWFVRSMAALWLAAGLVAWYAGSSQPVLVRHTIEMAGLGEELRGLKLVQLSDLHLDGSPSVNRWMEGVVSRVNSLRPDLIVITGDLLERSSQDGRNAARLLRGLKARLGVWAVPGNHDHYFGLEKYGEVLKEAGIHDLRNRSTRLPGGLVLAGVDDDSGGSASARGNTPPAMDAALAGLAPEAPAILLAHRPLRFKEAVAKGVDLQLSGHTHAGQFPPVSFITPLIYTYHHGLYTGSAARIYTTSGTRLWGMPFRLFTRNEMVEFTLVPAKGGTKP